MEKYTHILLQERVQIFKWLCAGMSRRAIGKSLGRSPSSITRECQRNSDKQGYYLYPQQAQELADKRKAKHGYAVTRVPFLKDYVIARLHDYWSPIAIAGRWSLEHPDQSITCESLYAWIYSKEGLTLGLPKFLPRAKSKRGKVRARKSKATISCRVSIARRPESINQRSELGHLEGDLVFNQGSQSSNVLTLVDRKSRFVVLTKNKSKQSVVVIDAMDKAIEQCNANSITLDNGSEFSGHMRITNKFSIPTYFCDPGAPWQKGSVENMNKMLRRFIPFELNAHNVTQEKLDLIAYILNNTPRKSLNFLTPFEVQNGYDKKIIKSESRMKSACPAIEGFCRISNMNLSSGALRY